MTIDTIITTIIVNTALFISLLYVAVRNRIQEWPLPNSET